MSKKILIIAEAGVNHNGDLNIANELIDVAADAGADYVKFQTFNPTLLASSFAKQATYQKKNTGINQSQLEMLANLELKKRDHISLIDRCKKKKIKFLSTSFDIQSTRFLRKLDLGLFKIPSGEITNLPYLELIGSYQEKIILSTGMANLGEIEAAIQVLEKNGTTRNQITLMHCTTEYPAPFSEVNLKAMRSLKETFGTNIGYSDHTIGITISIAAAAQGASIIEKHFTLDKNMRGPDHKASLDPIELQSLIHSIRIVEKSLGDGIKRPSKSELKNIKIARKSVIAKKSIKRGEVFSLNNICIKRPGDGISPMNLDQVLGQKAKRKFKIDEKIEL
ncbi:N-acetylneuraminate synthase [Gammaproteobacteria bacterium]|nr:N-acetylneuraminate synthase [Gammaproteobacteria bacterium]MDC1112665.1 N-acetylneuraminate synthase [bacterium]|tara:strand:- start:855 stop:1862 length:1008 start_codon:yes stop_codon:yes gene_type:complete